MNILVAGGAGYIGSHFCKLAARVGHKVVVYDNLSTGHRDFVKWGPFVQGNLLDTTKIQAALIEHNIDAVVSFALRSCTIDSFKDSDAYWQNNVEGTRSLLWAMSQASVGQIVFSSSGAVYGVTAQPFTSEKDPLRPQSPYAETLIACEEMIQEFQGGLPGARAAVLRYFNVVGCDDAGELWEWHEDETHLVPCLIESLLNSEPIIVYGRQYATRDGTCVRDFVDVNDLAAVHLNALLHLEDDAFFISNVGAGRGYSVLDVVDVLSEILHKKPRLEFHEARPGDPPRLVADATQFREWCSVPLRPLKESLKNLLLPEGAERGALPRLRLGRPKTAADEFNSDHSHPSIG